MTTARAAVRVAVVARAEVKWAEAAWEKYRPPETHELTEDLKRRSREMAERAMQRKYSAEDTRGA